MDLLKIFQDCWGWCRGNNANQTLPSSPETTDEINNGGAEPESSLVVVTFEETSEEEETKLDLEVINQIKDFDHKDLTEEQNLLIDKLILNEELKKYYKIFGLCKQCKQPKNNYYWCRICTFQQNFKNWTSENHDIDEFIQKAQLKAKDYYEVLEWIEYDRFENVEYLAKGGFGTTYKAIWKDGYIDEFYNNQFTRKKDDEKGHPVALKCLNNSKDITVEFLREVRYFF